MAKAAGSEATLFLEGVAGGSMAPGGKLYLYSRNSDGRTPLYAKPVAGGSEWMMFPDIGFDMDTMRGFSYAVTPDGRNVLYSNRNDGHKTYMKGVEDAWEGVWFADAMSSVAFSVLMTPDGRYAFYAGNDGNTYRKEMNSATSQFSLISSTPENNATDIPTNGVIGLNFSKPVDESTVPGNIVLQKSGVPVNTAAISYSGGIVTFHATQPLDKNSPYTVLVHSGLKSADGDVFGTEWSSSFTTGDAPGIPNDSAIIWSTGLAPSCSTYGYIASHPECSILNLISVDSNNQVVYDGASTAGSPVGDPVNLSTGEFTYSNTLLHYKGDGPEYSHRKNPPSRDDEQTRPGK